MAIDNKLSDKSCSECDSTSVYYPGEIHYIDGDKSNKSQGNMAMVCPRCRAHILLSRFNPEDIWLLKARGLNYAQIARLLGISREWVRQLCKRYETQLARVDVDKLVKQAQNIERYWQYDFDDEAMRLVKKTGKKHLTDRRTWKKRILAEAQRMGLIPKTEEAQNERQHP